VRKQQPIKLSAVTYKLSLSLYKLINKLNQADIINTLKQTDILNNLDTKGNVFNVI